MPIDTPARLAVLGAGPIGLEAALYGRFLGYEVTLFEQGDVAENVRKWSHVEMYTPFRENVTSLALAAMEAQGVAQLPTGDSLLSGEQYNEKYILPLSRTDLLRSCIRSSSVVEDIQVVPSVDSCDEPDDEYAPERFLLTVRDNESDQHEFRFAGVLDASGSYGTPFGLGPDGQVLPGQRDAADRIDFQIPKWDRIDPSRSVVALFGQGPLAASTVLRLAAQLPDAADRNLRLLWLCTPFDESAAEPIQMDLIRRAIRIAESSPSVEVLHVAHLTEIDSTEDGIVLAVMADAAIETRKVNRLLVATTGPIFHGPGGRLKATYRRNELVDSDEDFFLLGAKAFDQPDFFLLKHGYCQIRDAFAAIGDRKDLDLYQSIKPSTNYWDE